MLIYLDHRSRYVCVEEHYVTVRVLISKSPTFCPHFPNTCVYQQMISNVWFLEIKMAEMGKRSSLSDCQMCHLKFNTDTRVPRILPCYHTLCHQCIQSLLDEAGHHIKCPICDRQHEVPCTRDAEAFPVNEDKLEVVRLLQQREEQYV